ncbi:helix-turn-helix domain-containing protein [Duganella sp. S19_KUP01_CR8]|uniref:helix-turn-helix domain-containing protein n=1 Tax=Duganella sp. S19_KUP01_CR8 TaxID=3025502 RepID=UPI002FCDB0C8
MPDPKMQNAGVEAGAYADLAGGRESADEMVRTESSTNPRILDSKSTATAIQLEKAILLLRQGPKTTIELRSQGIMMPAARVFQLKNEYGFSIQTELLPLYDAEGRRHSKCARYHLIEGSGKMGHVSSSLEGA